MLPFDCNPLVYLENKNWKMEFLWSEKPLQAKITEAWKNNDQISQQ